MKETTGISVAIIGSGGAGALTAGNLLLEATSLAGWHALLTRTVGPQIRGGEAAALLRFASYPIACLSDQFDLLIAIDWLNANRFDSEIRLGPESLVIGDAQGGEPPPSVLASGARIVTIPMKEIAKAIADARPN